MLAPEDGPVQPAAGAPPIRDRIVERIPIEQHDGASGADLWRALLDDGTAIIVKRFDQDRDLTIKLSPGREVREILLWQAGLLDRLPAGIGHAILDAWQEDERWLVAMRDVSDGMLSYQSFISRADCRRFLAAGSAVHDAFQGDEIAGLWPLGRRLTVFSRAVMGAERGSGNPLPPMVLEGWDRFEQLAPPSIARVVFGIHDDPSRLVEALLAHNRPTLLHGDLWLANASLRPDEVVLIDWALATWGPPIVDFTSFLVGCAGQVDATREQLLDDIRDSMGEHHDETAMTVGLVGGIVEMGWNLAWHAAEHPGPATREPLDWWLAAAERAVATGLIG